MGTRLNKKCKWRHLNEGSWEKSMVDSGLYSQDNENPVIVLFGFAFWLLQRTEHSYCEPFAEFGHM